MLDKAQNAMVIIIIIMMAAAIFKYIDDDDVSVYRLFLAYNAENYLIASFSLLVDFLIRNRF